jgi:O-antigen ligase
LQHSQARILVCVASVGALCVAVGLPTLLALNQPPSPTALNQGAAIGGWGLAVAMAALASREAVPPLRTALRDAWAPLFALALIAASAGLSGLLGHLPSALSLSSLGMLLVTAGVLLAGAAAPDSPALRLGFMAALAAAGVCSLVIGLMQVFVPGWVDGTWIARSGIAGRAVGNLRQPNHLSTLLLWSAVAVVPLFEAAPTSPLRRVARAALAVVYAGLLFGVVLSGSRTGLVGVGVLALWGATDKRLSGAARGLLVAAPLVCLGSWVLLEWWSASHHTAALGVATRLGSEDISASRFAIWRDTFWLIAHHPWLGVGFGEFNFAWSLTPFPQRPTAFFDHTHNLPLHLAVELGVPLALLLLALLGWGLWQAFRRSAAAQGAPGAARRAAFVMVLLMAVHSQLEYPLWYAYFLLPTAFAWGLCLGRPQGVDAAHARSGRWLLASGAAMVVAAVAMVWDYSRVVAIFAPQASSTESLAERIVEGRHSWFFAHHADYALVTTIDGAATLPGVFDRAPHFLLDTRLMIAWSRGLAAQGDVERARHIAARLREFRNPNAKEFFAPCDDAAVVDKPFQCTPPSRAFGWRDFLL